MRMVGLAAALFGVWLLLSGYFQPLLLILGVASSILAMLLAWRMRLLEASWRPAMGLRFLAFLPWLIWEVVKSNVQVARVVLDLRLPISPRIIRLPSPATSDEGRALYANSITLTPGTVTLAVDDRGFEVHALTEEAATGLEEGGMARRVAQVEGNS